MNFMEARISLESRLFPCCSVQDEGKQRQKAAALHIALFKVIKRQKQEEPVTQKVLPQFFILRQHLIAFLFFP